ncbi:site-specific DNA methyltransferase [Stappia sp. 22II-S9-Z10]|nr:site-specific DNA methyltransferase [Stappia sp. 22II-S9-Z10]
MGVRLFHGDCREAVDFLPPIDAVVTDPPYHLTSIVKRFGKAGSAAAKSDGPSGVYKRASAGFMGQAWDGGDVAFQPETWVRIGEAMKPGAHLVAFGGSRTFHRLVCAIEDAGFEIRDTLFWLYGSGFPKSHDVSKGIDKALGAEREKVRRKPRAATSGTMAGSSDTRPWIELSRERGFHEVDGDTPATAAAAAWEGWGTALKPAFEPIVLARKPLDGTVAANVLAHGTGAVNVDACRIEGADAPASWPTPRGGIWRPDAAARGELVASDKGRWPANVLHDGEAFGDAEWSRYFYCAKASKADRAGSKHPTVKPQSLMRWLCRLITPPGGTILDPFAGSGSTLAAAGAEGFDAIGCDITDQWIAEMESRFDVTARSVELEAMLA